MAIYVMHVQDLCRAIGNRAFLCDVRPIGAAEVAALLNTGRAGFVSREAMANDIALALGISLCCDAFPSDIGVGDEVIVVAPADVTADRLECLSMEVMILHSESRPARPTEGV